MERHSLPVTVFAQFGKEISMELTVVLAAQPGLCGMLSAVLYGG